MPVYFNPVCTRSGNHIKLNTVIVKELEIVLVIVIVIDVCIGYAYRIDTVCIRYYLMPNMR